MSFSVRGAIALALTAVACGGSIATPDGGTANDGGSSQDGTTGDGGGKGCGASSECASTQYCDFNGHCQFAALKKGTCKPRPTACPDLYAPTCACDGKVYSSPCDTYGAGLDVDKEGACPAPPGWISCGQGFCSKDINYCVKTSNDAIDPNDPVKFYTKCANIPALCQGQTSCACFPPNVPCPGGQCSYKDGFTVTCPGG